MPTEHIKYDDVLREGTDKLNSAIDQANKAEVDSEEALNTANQALSNSESTQTQLDTIVIEGDSSVEAAQARVDTDGVAHTTLKERLDFEHTEVTTRLADIAVNVKNFGAVGDGIADDTQAIIDAVSSIENGVVFIPTGDYLITSNILIDKFIRIKGAGSRMTRIIVGADITPFTFKGSVNNLLALSGMGLSGITIEGATTNTADALQLIYTSRGVFSDVVINRSGGNGIYLRSMQDTVFENIYLRYCGNQSNGKSAVFMDEYDTTEGASPNQNVNDNKFIACTFEHDTGQLLISKGNSNNSNVFLGCKFEYGQTEGNLPPIVIKNASRYQFDNCRYTYYNTSPAMFDIYDSWGIEIFGTSLNQSNPNAFAILNNCRSANIQVVGRKIGNINVSGNSYHIKEHLIDQEVVYNFSLTRNTNQLESIDLRDITNSILGNTIEDDENAPLGYALKGSDSDFQPVVRINVGGLGVKKTGISVTFMVRSTLQQGYEFRIVNKSGSQIVTAQQIGTAYEEVTISVRPDQIDETAYIQVNNTSDQTGINLYIGDVYWEAKYYANSRPTEGTWEKGHIVWNGNPSAGVYLGWVCTSAGTPGTWKGFGLIES